MNPVTSTIVDRAIFVKRAGGKLPEFARETNVSLGLLRKALAKRRKQ